MQSALTGRQAAFTGTGPLFADLPVPPFPVTSTLTVGSRGGGPEAEMVGQQKAIAKQRGWWMGVFWFAGVALFVMELSVGLDYVQSRLAALVPDFIGCLPALGLAAWKLVESTFWNSGQLEATFQVVPFVTLPFLLLGLAVSMKPRNKFTQQANAKR